jgi:hypothetical protein
LAIPLTSIEIGKYYLLRIGDTTHVRYVVSIEADGRVHYLDRTAKKHWRHCIQERQYFASVSEREVPCDWTPDAEA